MLDVRGTTFRPADLPALEPGAATLALAAVPGGWLVQATAHVRISECCSCALTYYLNTTILIVDSSVKVCFGCLIGAASAGPGAWRFCACLQRSHPGGCIVQAAVHVQL